MLSRFAGSRSAGPRTKGENALKQDLTKQLVETGARDSSEASYLTLNSKPYLDPSILYYLERPIYLLIKKKTRFLYEAGCKFSIIL